MNILRWRQRRREQRNYRRLVVAELQRVTQDGWERHKPRSAAEVDRLGAQLGVPRGLSVEGS